jgi:SAM-dependent methyltransferase
MKKYELKNSYFKNRSSNMPDTILEIAQYKKEHGELPFKYNGNNWVYDAFCERQKRKGVYASQYLTPDSTVYSMMMLVDEYFEDESDVLEPCCGTGQITQELLKDNFNVQAFDIDYDMVELCKILYPELHIEKSDFRDVKGTHNQIIANPPYEIPELTEFLEWILSVQDSGGKSILLIPNGFIRKEKPKKLVEILDRFFILETKDMIEDFERTNTRAEIVVLQKIK